MTKMRIGMVVVAVCAAVQSAFAIDIEAGDVAALYDAMKANKSPINLKPGVYDLSTLTAQTVAEAGIAPTSTDARKAYLLPSGNIDVKGNTTKNWRDWTDADKVILRGNNTARLIYGYGSGGRNAKFYGIVFENGNSTASDGSAEGGAIHFMGPGSGFATNCIFQNCTAGGGGGVSYLMLRDCFFTNCTATGNGGAAVLDGSAPYNSPTNHLLNCVFVNCSAGGSGGAVRISDFRAPYGPKSGYVDGCTFIGNQAKEGGAIYANWPGLTMNCTFVGNRSTDAGGAISANSGNFGSCGSCVLSNCTFVANEGGNNGGAVNQWVTIYNCSFTSNVAHQVAGAVYAANACYGCGFTNNLAQTIGLTTGSETGGGAVYSGKIYTDCEFVGNASHYYGGAAFSAGAFTNCSFIGNCATNGGGAVAQGNCYKCLFSGNQAVMQNSGNGGAGHKGEYHFCTFTNNYARNYGGGCYMADVYDSTFVGNSSAARGGGVWSSKVYRSLFKDNIPAQSGRAGAAGGPEKSTKCVDCTFTGYGDVSGGVYVGCDFNGLKIYPGYAQTWVFDSIRNGSYSCYATNCLVRNCEVKNLVANNGVRMEVVNCTFANNKLQSAGTEVFTDRGIEYTSPTRYHVSTTVVANCIFSGNKINGTAKDFKIQTSTAETYEGPKCVTFYTNCMYEEGEVDSSGDNQGLDSCFKGKARFVGEKDANHPFLIRHASDARNRGENAAWMTTATDRAGNPRIAEETVDIGCYEVQRAPGMMLMLK